MSVLAIEVWEPETERYEEVDLAPVWMALESMTESGVDVEAMVEREYFNEAWGFNVVPL